ncbi:hypothetical protein B1B_16435, partial [mine drainage metagenome]
MADNKAGVVGRGSYESIYVQESSGSRIEIGDLLVVPEDEISILMKVASLRYGFPGEDPRLLREHIDEPAIATCKPIAAINRNGITPAKIIPGLGREVFFSTVDDLKSLTATGEKGIYLGNLRSGSKILDMKIAIDGFDLFTHHVLIAATTGRGKSNLLKTM